MVAREIRWPYPRTVASRTGTAPSRMRALPSRLWTVSRRHRAILVLLAAGAALRVVAHIAYQPALIYIDSIRYLGMSRTFEPSGLDPLGYSALLLSWILPFHDLALVALVQHVLGLAMGAGIYVLLLRWDVRRWLAASAAAPVLLDGYQLQIEHNIMSDTLFEALVLAALGVLLWRRRPSPWALAIGGVLLGLAATVRYVGVVLGTVAVCAVLLALRSSARRRVGVLGLVLAAVAGFTAPLFVYSSWSYVSGKGFTFQGATQGAMLYARAAPVTDCARLDAAGAPDQVVRVCPREPVDQREGPDFYANDPRSPGRSVPPPPRMSRQEVMGAFGLWAVRSQPWEIGFGVVRDFAKGFAPTRTQAANDVSLERWRFQVSYPSFPPQDPVRITHEYGGTEPRVNIAAARFLRDYQSVGYAPGPVLAAGMIAGLLGAAGIRMRRVPSRPDLRAACLLPSITGIGLLLLSAAFLFSWRYQLPALVLFPLAGALGVTALVGGAPDRGARADRLASPPPSAPRRRCDVQPADAA
jgi:hypothetical protein